MTSILPAVLSLAAIDAINPASITGAICLARERRAARLRMFVLASYSTYLLFGLALAFGPAAALRSGLADTPSLFGPTIEVAAGGLLVWVGVRIWRQRASVAAPDTPETPSRRWSGFPLGVLTTLADLPTATPLFVATALIAQTGAKAWADVGDLALYNVVCISPLLIVALAQRSAAREAGTRTRRSRTLLAWTPAVVAGFCVAGGAVVGCEGVAALI